MCQYSLGQWAGAFWQALTGVLAVVGVFEGSRGAREARGKHKQQVRHVMEAWGERVCSVIRAGGRTRKVECPVNSNGRHVRIEQ